MKFKVGDKVKCIRGGFYITEGKIYEIKGVYCRDNEDFVVIVDDTEHTRGYFECRFKNTLFNCQRRRLLM